MLRIILITTVISLIFNTIAKAGCGHDIDYEWGKYQDGKTTEFTFKNKGSKFIRITRIYVLDSDGDKIIDVKPKDYFTKKGRFVGPNETYKHKIITPDVYKYGKKASYKCKYQKPYEKSISDSIDSAVDSVENTLDDLNFLNGLSKHLRELLVYRLNSNDKLSDHKSELSKRYIEHSKNILDKDLILMIEIINETLVNYQRVNDKRMHIELCLMKIASLDSIKKKKSLIKTTELKVSKQKEILEIEDKDSSKLFKQPQINDISSLSIASLNFKKSVEKENDNVDLELPNDDFTDNDFEIAWKKFCELEKKDGNNNILSLLKMNQPFINDNLIIINTINKMNYKEMNGYKSKIQTFISKELNNYSIIVDVKLSEETDKKKFLNSKEKLEMIQKNNESIISLIEEFSLRI